MKRWHHAALLGILYMWVNLPTTHANTIQIQSHPRGLSVAIPMTTIPSFSVYRLSAPTRLVLEFASTRSMQSRAPAQWPNGPLTRIQVQAVIREQIRRRKLIMTLHRLDDYDIQLQQGWLRLVLVGPIAPKRPRPAPRRPKPTPRPRPILLARSTPKPVRLRPRPTPRPRPRPAPRREPPKRPWRNILAAAHQPQMRDRQRVTAQWKREQRDALSSILQSQRANIKEKLKRTERELLRLAAKQTKRADAATPTIAQPITAQADTVQERRIALAQQQAKRRFQAWFPEPTPPPTSIAPPRRTPPKPVAKKPLWPKGWAIAQSRMQQDERKGYQTATSGLNAAIKRQHLQEMEKVAKILATQRAMSARSQSREAPTPQKRLQQQESAHGQRIALLAALRKAKPKRVAVAIPKLRPRPLPTPRPIARKQTPPDRVEPRPVRQLPPTPRRTTPIPTKRAPLMPAPQPEFPASGPLPTILDAFRTLVPIKRKQKRTRPKQNQRGKGNHQLLAMRFSQSANTDRLILLLQSPPNAKCAYQTKGKGTKQLTITLLRTKAAGDESLEPIDTSMFLSYIRTVKATATPSARTITITIQLLRSVRAKIKHKGQQLLIIFPRYGRSF